MAEFRLSEYQICEPVGYGLSGVVFRCVGTDGRLAAVKRLNALAIDRDQIDRNCRRFLLAPPHPGVLPVREYRVDESPYFIASEWVEGGRTLADFSGALHETEAWPLILGLADAFSHLHRHGVHHNNLHPGNIFVEAGSEVRLRIADCGTGLAGRVHHIELGDSAWFSPPEQLEYPEDWEGGGAERWDVYRFGALVFWLINGVTPRGAGYRKWRESQAARGASRSVPVERLALAESMREEAAVSWKMPATERALQWRREIVDRCLSLDPAKRPVDMREVCEAFAEVNRWLEAERSQREVRSEIEEANRRLAVESALHAAHLRRARLVAACLVGSVVMVAAMAAGSFQRNRSLGNKVTEQDLMIGLQQSRIEELDRHLLRSGHELRGAREATDAVFTGIGAAGTSESVPVEGSLEWEKLVASRAYFEKNLEGYGEDPSKTPERARDHHHLARVLRKLGLNSEAREQFEQAVDLLNRLLDKAGGDRGREQDCEYRLAECHETLGTLIGPEPSLELLAVLRAASHHLGKLGERRPLDRPLALRKLNADFRLGRQLLEHREMAAAFTVLRSVGEQLGKSLAAAPDCASRLDLLAEVQHHSALALREVGTPGEAAGAYAAALETHSRLSGDQGPGEERSLRLGEIYADLGDLFLEQAADEETAQLYNEALRLLRPVHEKRPQHIETTLVLSRTLSRLARLQQGEHRQKDGHRMSAEAMEHLEACLAADPGHVEARISLVEIRAGHVDWIRDQSDTARRVMSQGLEMAETLWRDLDREAIGLAGVRADRQLRLAKLYETYAELSETLGDTDQARHCQERALRTRALLVSRNAVDGAPVPSGETL